MFLYNSFENKMKKTYASLNPTVKQIVFTQGEKEYVFIASAMRSLFKGREISALLPIYVSIYIYSSLQTGNYYAIKDYTSRKMIGYSEKEIYSMMALAMLARTSKKDFNINILEVISRIEQTIKSELNIQLQIKANLDTFNTRDEEDVGTSNNPILVPGISGVMEYVDKLLTESGEEVEAERTICMYLTDNKTNIDYAVDEYIIKNKTTKNEICKLSFNEYGTELCQFCPKGFKFKK